MTDFYRLRVDDQVGLLRDLAATALAQWQLEPAALALIKYRENAVFRVDTTSGERYALRIHRHGYHSDAALRSELEWMHALAEFGVEVPQVIPTTAANLFAVIAAEGVPEPRQVDLFGWLEGRQLGSVEDGIEDPGAIASTYRTIGRIAARLHNHASIWQLPPGFERHAWDVDGLVGNQPLWGRFWELEALTTGQRELLLAAREQVRRDLTAYGYNQTRYSLIHADFAPENLMVNGDSVRLIDFDDAGFGWHLFELATALYFIHRDPCFETARDALVAGYREHRDLPDDEVAQLPLFLTARSFTYLGWVHTRPETETARELTPELVDMACGLSARYLQR